MYVTKLYEHGQDYILTKQLFMTTCTPKCRSNHLALLLFSVFFINNVCWHRSNEILEILLEDADIAIIDGCCSLCPIKMWDKKSHFWQFSTWQIFWHPNFVILKYIWKQKWEKVVASVKWTVWELFSDRAVTKGSLHTFYVDHKNISG